MSREGDGKDPIKEGVSAAKLKPKRRAIVIGYDVEPAAPAIVSSAPKATEPEASKVKFKDTVEVRKFPFERGDEPSSHPGRPNKPKIGASPLSPVINKPLSDTPGLVIPRDSTNKSHRLADVSGDRSDPVIGESVQKIAHTAATIHQEASVEAERNIKALKAGEAIPIIKPAAQITHLDVDIVSEANANQKMKAISDSADAVSAPVRVTEAYKKNTKRADMEYVAALDAFDSGMGKEKDKPIISSSSSATKTPEDFEKAAKHLEQIESTRKVFNPDKAPGKSAMKGGRDAAASVSKSEPEPTTPKVAPPPATGKPKSEGPIR